MIVVPASHRLLDSVLFTISFILKVFREKAPRLYEVLFFILLFIYFSKKLFWSLRIFLLGTFHSHFSPLALLFKCSAFRITKCLSWDYNFYSHLSNECKSNIYHVIVIKIYNPLKMFILKEFFLKNILVFFNCYCTVVKCIFWCIFILIKLKLQKI